MDLTQTKTWKWWKRLLGHPTASHIKTPKPINPVLASISLAVQRIYGSIDNPYTITITFLMVTWTLHKISMLERSMSKFHALKANNNGKGYSVPFKWASILDILLDCVLVSKYLYAGVVIQASLTPHYNACIAKALYFISLLLCVMMNR